jgi:hypothetical protein
MKLGGTEKVLPFLLKRTMVQYTDKASVYRVIALPFQQKVDLGPTISSSA